MAQKARKDLAKANASALQMLHLGSLIVNVSFILLSFFLRSRSLKTWFIFSLPAFVCQYVLETSGRPKYTPSGGLDSPGQDLSAPGLTEYMLDIIWTTWACVVLVVLVGNWGWLLWAVIPIFAAFKAFSLFGAARGMMGGGAQGDMGVPMEEQQPRTRRQRRAAA